ncbi:uncharacterized [Tachysurus ichikawai]
MGSNEPSTSAAPENNPSVTDKGQSQEEKNTGECDQENDKEQVVMMDTLMTIKDMDSSSAFIFNLEKGLFTNSRCIISVVQTDQ